MLTGDSLSVIILFTPAGGVSALSDYCSDNVFSSIHKDCVDDHNVSQLMDTTCVKH